MITRDNLTVEYPKFQHLFTEGLNDAYPEISANIDLYGQDKEIDEVIDDFIDKCNRIIEQHEPVPSKKTGKSQKEPKRKKEPKQEGEGRAKVHEAIETDDITEDSPMPDSQGNEKTFNMIVMAKYKNEKFKAMDVGKGVQVSNLMYASLIKSDKLDELITLFKKEQTDNADWQFKIVKAGTSKILWQSGQAEKSKPATEPKPKLVRQSKISNQKSKIGNEVTELPLAVTFIKSYCSWNGKVKTKSQVYTFIKRLQKAIVEKRIRKASEYAPHIEYMQSRLIAFYNDMKSGTKTYEIPAAKLSELKTKCNMRWADHVVIIRAYINILNDTKTGLKEKAQNLLKKIEASSFVSEAKAAIGTITKSLKDYLSGKTEAPTINEMALQGLFGLAGLNGLGSLPNAPASISPATNDNKIVSAAEFKNASFNLMGFTGKWLQLIGNPSVPFKAMIWGTGGSGKSTLAIEFARYLAGTLNKRVLYIANEEGAGATLHEKMTRLNAFHLNLYITKTLPQRLVEYDFVFCDSANSMQLELSKFEKATKLYPRLSWVLLFQTTKDGNFLGEKNWQHAVDVEVYCENGKAKALKSRFGGKEEVGVW